MLQINGDNLSHTCANLMTLMASYHCTKRLQEKDQAQRLYKRVNPKAMLLVELLWKRETFKFSMWRASELITNPG